MRRRLTLLALLIPFMTVDLQAAVTTSAADATSDARRNARRYEIELQRQIDEVQAQMDRLNANKRDLVGKLEAIAAEAKKENAQATALQLQQLIEQVNNSHEAERKDLERKLDRFKQVAHKIDRKERLERNVGGKARGFTLKDTEGKAVSLNHHKGKVIVLEWMNPNCPYSRYYYESKIIPNLVKQYEDKGVVWLTINSTENSSDEETQAFVKLHGLTQPVLNDEKGMVARAYGARNTPHIFIIDRQGVIAYNGAVDDSPAKGGKQRQVNNYVDKALAQLVAGKAVSVSYSEPIGSPLGREF